MNKKEELIRRTMLIVREIFRRTMHAIPYCKSNMEWKFNHMLGYGLYCSHVRKALQSCFEEGGRIEHYDYHVQMITGQVHIVSGIFCIVHKQDTASGQGTPYEVVVCMCNGMAECVQIYGVKSARLLHRVKGFHEEIYFLEQAEILYIESSHNNVIWHCREYQVESRDSLKRLEMCMPDAFVRIHRGYIINVNHIFRIQNNEVQMTNGEILPIPARNCQSIRKQLFTQIGKQCISPDADTFVPESRMSGFQ